MTATTNGKPAADVVDVLRRADHRWATRNNDDPAPAEYLAHLAKYLEPRVVPSQSDAGPSISDAELPKLRDQLAAAEQLAVSRGAAVDQLTAELDSARTDARDLQHTAERLAVNVQNARQERDTATKQITDLTKQVGQLRADYDSAVADTGQLAGLYEQVVRERDQLAEQVAVVQAHVCSWPWPDPNERVLPCECGRPYPRYAVEELTEPIPPDPDGWRPLFDRIRAQLKGGPVRG
jgi:hypothetical protein